MSYFKVVKLENSVSTGHTPTGVSLSFESGPHQDNFWWPRYNLGAPYETVSEILYWMIKVYFSVFSWFIYLLCNVNNLSFGGESESVECKSRYSSGKIGWPWACGPELITSLFYLVSSCICSSLTGTCHAQRNQARMREAPGLVTSKLRRFIADWLGSKWHK